MTQPSYAIREMDRQPCVVRIHDGFVVAKCKSRKESDDKIKQLEWRRYKRRVNREWRNG